MKFLKPLAVALALLSAVPALALDPIIPAHPIGKVILGPGSSGDGSGICAAVPGSPLCRPLADRASDIPALTDFGGAVNGVWDTALARAMATDATTIMLPRGGDYPTTSGTYALLNKTFVGPGRLRLGADANGTGGRRTAPFRSFLTAFPGAVTNLDTDNLWGDINTSHMLQAGTSFVGADATGPSASTYKLLLGLSQTLRTYNYGGGFQFNPNNQSGGRSGAAVDVKIIKHGGQGDLGAGYNRVSVFGDTPGATHFLAKPAGGIGTGGDIFADTGSGDGKYLQNREINYHDNGTAAAVGAQVAHYNRTNMGNALGQVWVHDWVFGPSTANVAMDCAYCVQNNFRRGLDFSAASFEQGQQAAIALPPGGRIYWGAFAGGDKIGLRSTATSLGFTATYQDESGNLIFDVDVFNANAAATSNRTLVFRHMPSSPTGLQRGGLWSGSDGILRVARGDGT